jgi:hypothetical protein
VRAENPEGTEALDGPARRTFLRGVDHRPRRGDRPFADREELVLSIGIGDVDRNPRDVVPPFGKHLEYRVGVPTPDGFGHTGDATTEAMDPLEHNDAVADDDAGRWLVSGNVLACHLRETAPSSRAHEQAVGRRADDVAEDGTRFDRR